MSGKKQEKSAEGREMDGGEGAALTAAQAAQKVQRPPLEVGGKPRPVAPEEVLAWRADGAQVVVVTRDGQKLTGAL